MGNPLCPPSAPSVSSVTVPTLSSQVSALAYNRMQRRIPDRSQTPALSSPSVSGLTLASQVDALAYNRTQRRIPDRSSLAPCWLRPLSRLEPPASPPQGRLEMAMLFADEVG